jgi:hypothetical protein
MPWKKAHEALELVSQFQLNLEKRMTAIMKMKTEEKWR